ncbi:transcription termination/antitermination protein NusA [Candidatus Shapirobacteria bacterium]|nr:transcription termination/antitermination protein NusA [Candidatus Shapirobacteria bacterium]
MPRSIVRTEFASAVTQIANERAIDPAIVIDSIKSAILAAYRRDAKENKQEVEEEENYLVELDSKTGAAQIFLKKGKKTADVTPPGFGRIAAQTAKQVILQKIREAEKGAILDEYAKRAGTLATGMILRFEGENIIVDIGRAEAIMPPEEQVRSENYRLSQKLTFYIKEVNPGVKGREIVVSRADKNLVEGLFRREVPEVANGSVEIRVIAREAGIRTKVAVYSKATGIDPVGSCVGQKGVRVQAVISELFGEKIDIIQYSDEPEKFIASALSPAQNISVKIDKKGVAAEITVPDDQLSLAIGREGQNVRLASKLTGYKIDIKGKVIKKKKSLIS